jgi:ribosomal protein S18 acetylase RimI-like enzyme
MSKRPKRSWECAFHNRDNSGIRFGLVDLFGSRKRSHLKSQEQGESSACHRTNTRTDNEDFFTFRMEHREGGAMAQHYGEERILIFRSDRPGAIAKIIYSSSPADEDSEDEANSGGTTDIDNERELDMMAQAKVHVLSVKEDYRGYDLGGLLFSEAMASLRHRYCDDRRESRGIPHRSHMSSVRCQLDAEEDIRRHNKLIGFYEQLGCSVKPKAKIIYLNNNDGNTYRKISMQISLRARQEGERPEKRKEAVSMSLLDRKQGLLPVVLLEAPGKRVGVSSSPSRSNPAAGRVDWLVVETGEGLLEFHTTKGAILFVKPDGKCYTAFEDDETSCSHEENCSKFLLLRVSDARQRVLQGEEDSDVDSTSVEARQKELWMVQSTHGSFLTFDPISHSLTGSLQPTFWQADGRTLSLTCTCDTPPRRQHYRRMWAKQTVIYVNTMWERYLGFNLDHMSLKKALDLAHTLPANPFSMEPGVSTPSLRTLCVSVYISLHLRYICLWSSFLTRLFLFIMI